MGVDSIGSIMPAWDQGGSLHVVYGADRCHKIRTEEEAKITLDCLPLANGSVNCMMFDPPFLATMG